MTITFSLPTEQVPTDAVHHAQAAAGNAAVADEASGVLRDALSGTAPVDRILLKASAGAGKSYLLRRLVADALEHPRCARVAVVAFMNRQIFPLAVELGKELPGGRVCLFVSSDRWGDVPDEAHQVCTVVTSTSSIPTNCDVVVATSHKLGAINELNRQKNHLGAGYNGSAPYDVLFVDEAWQLAHHLFDKVSKAAPVTVGVGDVGQLPPLEIGTNPWRGDPGFNPFRAWPTEFDGDERTTAFELPAVWRPAVGHLPLWRAFYPEWRELNCVAGPDDRGMTAPGLAGVSREVWAQVSSGVPTLLEVDGLPAPETADVDLPLLEVVGSLLDELLAAGFSLRQARYDSAGTPTGETVEMRPGGSHADPLVAVLATRNQAVDDAADIVERLRERHGLTERDLLASTVDSWQGQTNGLTVVVHPLSGATQLDEFNSAFGRLAVACTRATHGLLMVTRPGLETLLTEAPARPGTPLGEPGNRQLPRQTHERILATFARGTLTHVPA
ncbi:hypothetical protein QOZ88_17280 [Blastococcus sp. BMG 814]|uniref:AAA domain-containing protein n=1 Tax=Blastococcus carthaginiensis TaxID=3050034 RepID=A0ABT9IH24_9ACTN|nr:hypothetical protein [Blastococcus carthaginiensis]MDP5184390.1 hypothetical protein [Blastococcus carthaginiensis]